MILSVIPAAGRDDTDGWRMTALGKLLRTTAFKLTLVYLSIFALFAVFLLGYFSWNTRRLITEQITETVDAEITGLSEQYRQGGIRRLVFVVDARSRRPGSSLYLVTTRAGDDKAGCLIGFASQVSIQPSRFLAGLSKRTTPSGWRVARRTWPCTCCRGTPVRWRGCSAVRPAIG